MKTNWLNLTSVSFATMLVLSTACQEKVAPELTDAGLGGATTTTTGGGGGGSSTTHNFAVSLTTTPTNVNPASLNYQMHKANELVSVPCSVADVVDAPDTLPSTRDISCFVEAEEWALYYNGLKFNVTADANTCDYVLYQPYSFQRYEAGLSGYDGAPRQMLRIDCNTDVTTYFSASAPATVGGMTNTSALTMAQMCGRTFEITSGAFSNTSDFVANPSDSSATQYCSYDYSDDPTPPGGKKGPNCDEGSILMVKATFSGVDDADADTNADDTLAEAIDTPTEATECGGNIRACTDGPLVDEMGTEWLTDGYTGRFGQTEGNSYAQTYNVPSPYSKKYNTNMYAANFTRQCAGQGSWNTLALFASSSNSYNPNLIADYADFGVDAVASGEDSRGFDVVRLSQDPFRAGLLTSTNSNILVTNFSSQPHYQFLCLDRSYEIKARIRVQVREWNKVFSPLTTSFAYISDVFNNLGIPYTAVMDATQSQVAPNAPWRPENDRADWDDYIRLSDATSCDTTTTATAVGTSVYPGQSL